MKSIFDPEFKYTPSFCTDIKKRFDTYLGTKTKRKSRLPSKEKAPVIQLVRKEK